MHFTFMLFSSRYFCNAKLFSLSNFPEAFHWAGDMREFHNEREPTKLNGCKFIHNSVPFYFFSSHVLTFNKVSRLFSILFSGRIYVLRKEKKTYFTRTKKWIKLFAITCKRNGSWLEPSLLIRNYLHTRVLENVND